MIKGNLAIIINYLFQTLLITYLLLLLSEQIWQGTVSVYLNLNYLLLVVILAGILDVFSIKPLVHKSHPTPLDYFFIFFLGVLGFAIIKFKTQQLGMLSWIIAVIASILIILLSVIVLQEDEDEHRDNK